MGKYILNTDIKYVYVYIDINCHFPVHSIVIPYTHKVRPVPFYVKYYDDMNRHIALLWSWWENSSKYVLVIIVTEMTIKKA